MIHVIHACSIQSHVLEELAGFDGELAPGFRHLPLTPHSVDPAHPAGETLAERTEELRAYQAAPTQPVLDDAVFQQHAASGPAVAVVLPPEHQFEGAGLGWRRDHHVHPVRPREGGSCAARHRLSRLKAVRNNLLTMFCRGARALHGA